MEPVRPSQDITARSPLVTSLQLFSDPVATWYTNRQRVASEVWPTYADLGICWKQIGRQVKVMPSRES